MSGDDHEEGGHERWLVSYADFMTLLFAFFTVLYATSEKNAEKTEKFQESVKRYLIKAGGGGAGGGVGGAVNQGDQHNSVIEPPIKTFRDQDKGESAVQLDDAESFVEGLSPEDRRRFVSDLTSDELGVRLTLPSRALFADQSDRFRPEAMAFLSKLGDLLVRAKRRVLIEGHVAVGEKGGTRSTWDFASARAVNVLRFVQKTHDVAADRLMATSFADGRPQFKDGPPARNSRLEIVLLSPDVTF